MSTEQHFHANYFLEKQIKIKRQQELLHELCNPPDHELELLYSHLENYLAVMHDDIPFHKESMKEAIVWFLANTCKHDPSNSTKYIIEEYITIREKKVKIRMTNVFNKEEIIPELKRLEDLLIHIPLNLDETTRVRDTIRYLKDWKFFYSREQEFEKGCWVGIRNEKIFVCSHDREKAADALMMQDPGVTVFLQVGASPSNL